MKHLILISIILFMQATVYAKDVKALGEYRVANAIHSIIQSTRKIYTSEISDKLLQDGTGSLLEYRHQKGFVPLPVQVIQQIGKDLSKSTGGNISIELKSKYFVNEKNRLIGREAEAWTYLEKQQNSAKNLKNMTWKPYVYINNAVDRDYLIYIVPDLATEYACIACHKSQENTASVKYAREQHGITGEPILKLWHMLGILKVMVAID